ncbi:alkaline phosphatase family protein [Caldilinea sp.]|jgi:2,3-bisphosphoglycerate-independent phosphoglycerate mutase|uniref:alkaline phosphatase family protein n=1 Tax=Caldilinea sp. TaxID=2293560 RepID=UPI0021DD9AC6|nr:alkaline phosphatase family protein [Caldilinea sp.]GIV69312.1 MAG: metalloenzyme [Caldilinea sp.]
MMQPMDSERRRVILLFLDGVGLGEDDPAINPLAGDAYPTLRALLDGRRLVAQTGRLSTADAELIPTDAALGVPGRPQSATGQATLLTGVNAAQHLGEHYGPRPDARLRALLDEHSIFLRLSQAGRSPYFCNAYPQRYFDAIRRGRRLLSAIPYAAVVAGQALLTYEDLCAGRALSADFTGEGWRSELGYPDAPIYSPREAGHALWRLSAPYDFVFFELWQTDLLGHAADRQGAIAFFQRFDAFLAGLLEVVDLARTLIIVTSDHGNVEDCSHGKHTANPALTLLLGAERQMHAASISSLADFAPIILRFLGVPEPETTRSPGKA